MYSNRCVGVLGFFATKNLSKMLVASTRMHLLNELNESRWRGKSAWVQRPMRVVNFLQRLTSFSGWQSTSKDSRCLFTVPKSPERQNSSICFDLEGILWHEQKSSTTKRVYTRQQTYICMQWKQKLRGLELDLFEKQRMEKNTAAPLLWMNGSLISL